ncbi:hypothetical protein [Kutzneria kofuensis]|uniref:Uncharacterized protein n=1 Tax=Kutzneria kofuensis TaxID=103725 RepID=A0A7W9NMK4_9PSEU|nr:hypothetical protein [Kutzneria kofuensis]MBB5897939.1 hypothetical protein [Kutzneria kofuensis]
MRMLLAAAPVTALPPHRIGWESYAGGDDTVSFDDIAVATARVGC